MTTQATIQQDLDLIEETLKTTRNLAKSTRYGGLSDLYYQAQSALDALGRIAEIVTTKQPQLF